MAKKIEEVRDGFLGDLPEEVRIKVMNLHKVIVDKIRAEFKLTKYNSINQTTWAKGWLEEFLAEPTDKNHIGSVRVYKKGKRYSCMIQCTGHVTNHRNAEEEELFHGLIRNAFTAIRPIARKKFDLTLSCESEHGEPFEGYDVWTKQKVAEQIWNLFEDKKIKKVSEFKESTDNTGSDTIIAEMKDLPVGLQNLLVEAAFALLGDIDESCGHTELHYNESYSGSIIIGENSKDSETFKESYEEYAQTFESANPGKLLDYDERSNTVEMFLTEEYAQKLFEYLDEKCCTEGDWGSTRTCTKLPNGKYQVPLDLYIQMKKMADAKEEVPETKKAMDPTHKGLVISEESEDDPFVESADPMVVEGKGTLKMIAKGIINNSSKDGYKIKQELVNTIANVISDKCLRNWAGSYNKLTIKLNTKANKVLDFKIPKLETEFVGRFIEGRETLNGLLHRNPEITISMSGDIFNTMKNPDDLYKFFYAAVRYYTVGVDKYAKMFGTETIKLDPTIKKLIGTTKLSAIVVAPIQMLFAFDGVDMTQKIFTVEKDEIDTICNFIKNISSRYKAPKEEQKSIVKDLNEMIRSFRESFDGMQFGAMADEVKRFYEGWYDETIVEMTEKFHNDQENLNWYRETTDMNVRYYQEKFGVKKLKKIPKDIVAYITIETECIKDGNDKMMIASYCLDKLEIVEWYIELIDCQSKKYIVPHTKPYLESLRTQLLACYKKIMDTPIPKADRSIITINGLPKGYEG